MRNESSGVTMLMMRYLTVSNAIQHEISPPLAGRVADSLWPYSCAGGEEGCPDGDVDEMAGRLTGWVNKVLEAHCPRARPSPYMKRWWNEDLTALRKSYTHWRNRACALRR
jgi:hypothetical protein